MLASAGVLTLGIRLRRPNGSLDVGVGFVSGMFKTSVGVSGPPIVILLQGRGLAKNAFRATSSTVIVWPGWNGSYNHRPRGVNP